MRKPQAVRFLERSPLGWVKYVGGPLLQKNGRFTAHVGPIELSPLVIARKRKQVERYENRSRKKRKDGKRQKSKMGVTKTAHKIRLVPATRCHLQSTSKLTVDS
ncbi:hypothetical protein EVAR_72061_1 [Eumeta japonica]|uniref:Uncharacterized protein n=1 Tax=Eumeta variegata TaxID=151549 RepID=A0A4C1T324_EUMVA|nr:hypothetical protein EVAR_72061_1 [Eumeta japonica]